MAKHVTLSISHDIEIGNVDVVFKVRDGSALIGTVTISKGSIDWRKANARNSINKTWREFADLMEG
jgi:hypothetical protein